MPITVLSAEVVSTPCDDGAIWARGPGFDTGVSSVNLFENVVERGTVFQIDLPLIETVENCGVPIGDFFRIGSVVAEVWVSHEGTFGAAVAGVLECRIAEDGDSVLLMESGWRRR